MLSVTSIVPPALAGLVAIAKEDIPEPVDESIVITLAVVVIVVPPVPKNSTVSSEKSDPDSDNVLVFAIPLTPNVALPFPPDIVIISPSTYPAPEVYIPNACTSPVAGLTFTIFIVSPAPVALLVVVAATPVV